jgi:hypothetical protein
VEVDFLCCWWVEVDGVLLNLLAWIWVLAVGFCGFLLGFDLRWVAVALNGGSWWLSRGGSHGLRLSQFCGCHGSHGCECDREEMK